MNPLITFVSFVGSALATKSILNRVTPTPTPRPLSEYDDVGYEDPQTGEWHSLLPRHGHFNSAGVWVYEEE